MSSYSSNVRRGAGSMQRYSFSKAATSIGLTPSGNAAFQSVHMAQNYMSCQVPYFCLRDHNLNGQWAANHSDPVYYSSLRLQRKLHSSALKVTIVPTNQKEHEKNEWGHSLMSVTHRLLDHHIQHKWQWLDAITTHWLLCSACRKVLNNLLNISADNYAKICILSFCCISRSNGKTQPWCQLDLKRYG